MPVIAPAAEPTPLTPQQQDLLGDRTLLVVGGRQRAPRSATDNHQGWYGFGTGVVLRVGAGAVTPLLDWTAEPGTVGPDDPVLCKCATRRGDLLYASSETEVFVLDLDTLEVRTHLSLPFFNDVHHVVPTPAGTLLVAVSGLDLVVDLALDGTVLRAWNTRTLGSGADPWEGVDRTLDHRIGVNLKPHRSHPNHLLLLGDEPFATRFEQRDAISLLDPDRRIHLGGERVHDGFVHEGSLFFTTVDGTVVQVDQASLEVVAVHRLGDHTHGLLGWTRGLRMDADGAWVGFSRIRPTRTRQTLSWIRTGFTASLPTRIGRYAGPGLAHAGDIELERAGCNAVFTICDG